MKFAVIALLGLVGAVKINKGYDASDPLGRNVAKDQHGEMHLSGYNGADEDEQRVGAFSQGVYCTRDVHGFSLLMLCVRPLAGRFTLKCALMRCS